ERFYAPSLSKVPLARLVIQPDNRGTAPAILYGLLRVSTMTAEGSVAIFPSDHYVSDDEAFARFVGRAFEAAEARTHLVVLLGVVPHSGEVGYGWIEPGEGYQRPRDRSFSRAAFLGKAVLCGRANPPGPRLSVE